ncbi:hypothetical protein PG994_007520 [Apiospora phragmitis]|uniref:Lysine-specific metallo-endopeptidase domain-containing protein n=1 Tax=Apiospora phragmitis TaxID=2905665 RepID=A0ABR1V1S4_9PEZI
MPDNIDKYEPWWTGTLTHLNGYYFTEYGGKYCYEDDLGITEETQLFRKGANSQAVNVPVVKSIIICPYSFGKSPKPKSYKEANALLIHGRNLADAIPKSATLVHEAFHTLHGGYLLDGYQETSGCSNFGAADSQRNPENYVFFVAHMYHMYDTKDGDEPWSMSTNWDFEPSGRVQNRVLGAIETYQAEQT